VRYSCNLPMLHRRAPWTWRSCSQSPSSPGTEPASGCTAGALLCVPTYVAWQMCCTCTCSLQPAPQCHSGRTALSGDCSSEVALCRLVRRSVLADAGARCRMSFRARGTVCGGSTVCIVTVSSVASRLFKCFGSRKCTRELWPVVTHRALEVLHGTHHNVRSVLQQHARHWSCASASPCSSRRA